MRLCRFRDDRVARVAVFEDDGIIPLAPLAAALGLDVPEDAGLLDLLPGGRLADRAAALAGRWADLRGAARVIPLDRARLLVPIPAPPKMLFLAGNYAKHVEERGGVAAERRETFPYVFTKPPSTTLTNPGDPIRIPKVSPDHVDWECELGVILGKGGREIDEGDALAHVAGYTVVNDISDRKFTPNPGRKPRERDKFFDWLHGKWHDTFCPMGPCVLSAAGVDPQALPITLKVNGQTEQDATTAQMVFPVAAVIAFVSSFVTLEPGDIIATGTPSGVGSASGTYLKPGDVVEAAVGGIGVLRNPVVAGD